MRQRISSTIRHGLSTHPDYPPIQDHALIGDGSTAALVGVDATIRWLCLPRFDGPAFVGVVARRPGGRGVDGAARWPAQCDPALPSRYPRMTATIAAVRQGLSADGDLLYRYLPHESPDGRGEEGAFLLCSFWWVDNLAGGGSLTEARGSAVNLARAHAAEESRGEASHVTRSSL